MVPPCYRHRIFSFEVIPSKLNNITSQCVFSNFLSFSFLTFDVAIHLYFNLLLLFMLKLTLVYTSHCLWQSLAPHNSLNCICSLASVYFRIYFVNAWSSPRTISTGQLHTLLYFHLRPINQIVFLGPYSIMDERSHLRESFTLRCFQRLSRPYLATQLCPWQDNWCTRGTSIPVLSY